MLVSIETTVAALWRLQSRLTCVSVLQVNPQDCWILAHNVGPVNILKLYCARGREIQAFPAQVQYVSSEILLHGYRELRECPQKASRFARDPIHYFRFSPA